MILTTASASAQRTDILSKQNRVVLSDEDEGFKSLKAKKGVKEMKRKSKDIMRGLWLAYIAGDEKAFDRVSLRAFIEPEQETEKETEVKNIYAIEPVDFEGEE